MTYQISKVENISLFIFTLLIYVVGINGESGIDVIVGLTAPFLVSLTALFLNRNGRAWRIFWIVIAVITGLVATFPLFFIFGYKT